MGFDDELDRKRLALKINKELDEYRPKWGDFEKYRPAEEINADMKELSDYQTSKGYNKQENRDKLTDGILIEKLFLDVDTNDLLGEEALYDELITDNEDHLIGVIPAHEYDDTFNNADMVCLVRNSLTNHEEVIFTVDCTSNFSLAENKMNYRRTKDKIKGFTDLKYFRNTNGYGEDANPKKLEKVPRFVVGVDADLAREALANYNDWTKDEIDAKRNTIKYHLLKELSAQAEGRDERLSKYFDRLLESFNENHDASKCDNDFISNKIIEVAEWTQ